MDDVKKKERNYAILKPIDVYLMFLEWKEHIKNTIIEVDTSFINRDTGENVKLKKNKPATLESFLLYSTLTLDAWKKISVSKESELPNIYFLFNKRKIDDLANKYPEYAEYFIDKEEHLNFQFVAREIKLFIEGFMIEKGMTGEYNQKSIEFYIENNSPDRYRSKPDIQINIEDNRPKWLNKAYGLIDQETQDITHEEIDNNS